MTVDRNLRLQQLLCRGVDIGGIGKCNVFTDLLLHGDTRGGVSERTQIAGVNLHGPGSKKLLNPAAYGRVEGAAEQHVRRRTRADRLLLLLRVEALLALCAA